MGLDKLKDFPRLAGTAPDGQRATTANIFAQGPEPDPRNLVDYPTTPETARQSQLPFVLQMEQSGGQPLSAEQMARRLARMELEELKGNPPLLIQHIATRLLEHGRALGLHEGAQLQRRSEMERISRILDAETRAFPDVDAGSASLEMWRDGRRRLWSALTEWHDERSRTYPVPPDRSIPELLLKVAQSLIIPPPPTGIFARARRTVSEYGNAFASFLEAVSEVLERKRLEQERTILAQRVYLGRDDEPQI